MGDKQFMEQLKTIKTNFKTFQLSNSKDVVELLYDCNRIGIDLNQVWSELEANANSFPIEMLRVLQSGPQLYIETWGRITTQQILIPITQRIDYIQKQIEDILEQQNRILDQQNQFNDELHQVHQKVDVIVKHIVVTR